MTVWGFVKAVVTAPFLAAICAAIGWVNAGTIIFLDFVVHWALGAEQGLISQVLLVVGKTPAARLRCVRVHGGIRLRGAGAIGFARHAGQVQKTSHRWRERIAPVLSSDAIRRRRLWLRYDGPSHLMTMAPTRTGKGVVHHHPNLLTLQRSSSASIRKARMPGSRHGRGKASAHCMCSTRSG